MRAVPLVLLFFTLYSGYGQANKQPIYRVLVTTHNGVQLEGVLTALHDSTLQFVPLNQISNGPITGDYKFITYRVQDIYMMRFRRKGAPGRTALKLGLGSAALGALIGNMAYSPCTSSNGGFGCFQPFDRAGLAKVGAVLGLTFGTGIGFLAGSSSKRYYLRGDFETYRQMRHTLSTYAYPLPLTAQTR